MADDRAGMSPQEIEELRTAQSREQAPHRPAPADAGAWGRTLEAPRGGPMIGSGAAEAPSSESPGDDGGTDFEMEADVGDEYSDEYAEHDDYEEDDTGAAF